MQKNKNEVWAFFSSVKLALFTFFVLAVTSIIGTVIQQGKEMQYYVDTFGAGTAKLFQLLNVPDMYNSWWFISLLVLFSINLIVCTIDRFPNIWRLVHLDNLAMDVGRIVKMPKRQAFSSDLPVAEIAQAVEGVSSSWHFERAEKDGGVLFAAQKGNWSRLGVIAVHISILLIFAGAIVGSILGFKGSVMIREGGSVKQIYLRDANNSAMPLDFELRCDRFELELYDTGAPKEFTSDLVVLQDGKEVLKKSIEVNDPLQYGGLTFYQSSYQPLEDGYAIEIENETTKVSKKFFVSPGRPIKWAEESLDFGITNRMGPYAMGRYRHKIWFNDASQKPIEFWTEEGKMVIVERPDTNYTFSIRQLYYTGLQVTKDPGVWFVYFGCAIMLLGLYVAFFLSHKKVWIYISSEESRSRLHLSGTSNKNMIGFENDFSALTELLEQNDSLKLTRE
ncbi:MAG: cytochrome c biogenesis protein ResB [Desulfobulbaceae bacterium]|nr:cytochrome c biogenesis protein ResB [Desulfobulbaceae bacterium]